MNIPSNGFSINTGAPLPFLPPPPGAPATYVAPSDSWTPSAAPAAAPAYQQPTFQARPEAPARDESYQFACFRPENWTYPSTLTNNTYTPANTNSGTDPRVAMMRQREDAFIQNRRNMAAGWNNYSRSIVDPNRGFNGQGGYNNNGYNGQYGNGYNNNPGSYLYGNNVYGNNAGMRRNQNYY
ncbi:MAG: hypothetical protein KF760_33985 [Candidatus Eremiobacteraeota bacterium]|nr:hypothetical protein [Candidatus Eremiobacteraeota bacterium]MCW5869338.1 hypothetical protein [Candidatus Eremiobacteraeota bacterium]